MQKTRKTRGKKAKDANAKTNVVEFHPEHTELARYVSRVANETYGHSRPLMPAQPWWENLDPVFHLFPDTFYLQWRAQSTVWSLAAVDTAFRTGLASISLAGGMLPTLGRIFKDKTDRHFYTQLASAGKVEDVFRTPENVPEVRRKTASSAVAPKEAIVESLSFKSHYQTLNPQLSKHYQRFKRNSIVHAQYWHHGDKPRPTLLIVHGYMMSSYQINALFFRADWFFKKGYDIVLYTQPFHGQRKETLAPFSGHGVFGHGISHMNEMFAQSVFDFRTLLNWLDDQGVPSYGVTGLSLGGYLSGLLASCEKRLQFSIPVVPVASMTDVIFQWAPASWVVRSGLRALGITVQEARHSMAAVSPLTWEPVLDHSRLMIVGGAGDRIVPPKHARLLWDHWKKPLMHWFPGNHIVHVDQGRYLKQMMVFMRRLGFQA